METLWKTLVNDFAFHGQTGVETWNRAKWNVEKKIIFQHRKMGFLPEYKWLENALSDSLGIKDEVIFEV